MKKTEGDKRIVYNFQYINTFKIYKYVYVFN